jgi:hypothetical protein
MSAPRRRSFAGDKTMAVQASNPRGGLRGRCSLWGADIAWQALSACHHAPCTRLGVLCAATMMKRHGGQQHELSMLAGGSHEIFGMPAFGRTLAAE